jgi:serine/threonine-protein kinase
LIVPATLGRWELVEPLSVSGRSSVYRARPLGCRSDGPADYVVKCIEAAHRNNPLAVGMLQREAFVGRSVSHPHLAPVLAAHVDAPPYYFVMPRLEGATLARTLADAVRLEAAEALWIARQTAEALAAMHDAGWRHGDVKPANLFLAASGHVTLIDLGFAGRIPQRRQADEPICGTPAYTAPECLSPAHAVTRQADVYSLGVTLFEMLAGQRPYAAQDPADLAAAHLYGPTPEVRKLAPAAPRELSHLLRRMLAKDPLRRPDSYELVEQLTRLEIECFSLHPWAA